MDTIDKKALSERDICTKYITPAILKAGWNVYTQIREEVTFTKGRIIIKGSNISRGESKRADYILYYKLNIPIAVIEAKDNKHIIGDGMQQALAYAEMFIRGTKTVFRPDFLKLQLDSFVANAIKSRARGGAMYNISLGDLKEMIVFIPPLAEQHRIVAKVDQLMSLCDVLEAHQQKKRESRAHINSAALDRLLAARAPGEFAEGWRRISDNFDLLYDAPENVRALKKVLMQLAVRGKLVPQNPNDEPASILLERITVEKKKLMKEGKIKENGLFPIENEDLLFELPSGWKWTCLYDIGKINPRNNTEDDKEVSFIPMTLISETSIKPIGSEKCRWGEVKKGFTHFAEDDVVLAKITPCFQNGKSAVMRGLTNNLGAGTTELHVFRPILNESVYPEYVLLYLRSPQFLSEGVEKMTGTAGQKRIPKEYFAGNPFPLPPFEEQRRIVARVDQLMSLCDKLEAGLMRSQADSEKLMEAVVGRMLAGGGSNK